jgi:SynChlorMet cassette radical SAM/SPASM protein ScmF
MSGPEPVNLAYPLRQLYCYLTEGCNLRCRHCWIVPEEDDTPRRIRAMLDPELFHFVVKQAKPLGLTGVKLTGGEPFLHPRIEDFLAIIHQEGLRLVVETNGVLLTPELARRVAAGKHPHISVSLDGADAETHEWVRQVPGSFKAALQGLGYLVEAGLRPQIIFCLLRQNYQQLEAVVRLAQELGAGSVKINLIQPSPRGDRLNEEGETLSVPEIVALGRWVELELAPQASIPLFFHHPPAFRPLSRMWQKNGWDCSVCSIRSILGLLADGSYALCGIGENLPEMVFGHASREPLERVWQEHPVLREIREGLPERLEGICGDCLHKGRCLGSCLAANYYQERHLWAPFWFCLKAAEADLFPPTRRRSSFTKPGVNPETGKNLAEPGNLSMTV